MDDLTSPSPSCRRCAVWEYTEKEIVDIFVLLRFRGIAKHPTHLTNISPRRLA
jgi:hypothetical protein